jgi:thiol-disulfide isomerase/thioredoxin
MTMICFRFDQLSHRVFARRHVLIAVLVCGAATAKVAHADDPPAAGIMTLGSGDKLPGRFCPSEGAGSVRWQGTIFTAPFEFETRAISAIRFPAAEPPVETQGEFALELTGDDILSGRFIGWSGAAVRFESTHFGPLSIRPGAIRRLYRIDDNPLLVMHSLSGLAGWKEAVAGEWKEEGAHVWTDSEVAVLTGDFNLPDRAVVEFEISWTKPPNFVFAIGVDPTMVVDDRAHGWRFEAWNLVLAAVREQAGIADVDHIQDLPKEAGRIHLIAYLDQVAGEMEVFHVSGTPAGKIAVRSTNLPGERGNADRTGRGIRLVNRHGDIRLERLRIARWNGLLPSSSVSGEARFELAAADGNIVSGEIVGLDADAGAFVIRDGDRERALPMKQVAAVELPVDPDAPKAEAFALLQDSTRVSGTVQEVHEDHIVVVNRDITEPLSVPLTMLRSLSFTQNGEAAELAKGEGRSGRLSVGGLTLAGCLAAGIERPDASCLVWHPDGSRTSSPLRRDASGRIVYRNTPPTRPEARQPNTPEHRAMQIRELQVRQLIERQGRAERPPDPGRFARLFLEKANEPRPVRTEIGRHNLHLRTGDIIACTVKSIDEAGVTIESSIVEGGLVPHEKIKAVELVAAGTPPSLDDAKKQRLLTLPRLMEASPPTHLLCAQTGDFLRCRLLGLADNEIRVEMQLEEIAIPLDRVAQIIWFHPDELEQQPANGEKTSPVAAADGAAPLATTDYTRLAQVLLPGGKRVTFDPEEVGDEVISGTSDVLGPCRFPLSNVDQLLFGAEIETAAAELVYHAWRLHPAIKPLIAQDFEAEGAGVVSPLVGQPAPEIDLELLGGERFRLSECAGQIVVLDFWASWCGPCMQTMPLLEEALREFDPADVRFVSVNLEERADHIGDVLERHELNLSVALDVDGAVARQYEANAIPQLVIVDREGRVARLYVGGGPKVVEQLKASLTELLGSE